MRLFAAIELPEDVRAALFSAAIDLRARLGALDARWVEPEKLHLTVRFIGHVADDSAPALIERVRRPVAVAPFDVRLGACGVFPRSGQPRVIWVGITEGAPALVRIHEELDARLVPLGYEAEQRRFTAHLTLARVRSAKRSASVRALVSACPVPDLRCHVPHVTLFRSHLSPRGSRYEIVATIPLTG
jgi:RNA 2',3'-cyclic 3'-phosphodiesterase